MAKKTEAIRVIQYKYPGQKWEDVCEYHLSDYQGNVVALNRGAQHDLKEYRLSDTTGSYRLINRRIKL